MALVYKAKMTHSFAPSALHLGTFFKTMTSLYAEQQHTDLVLVAGSGGSDEGASSEEESTTESKSAIFGTHQMILASCSHYVRDLILSTTDGCTCDTLTIYLPDFEANTVKNLLCLLYTGSSLGDCSMDELKLLVETLKIDICNLSTKSQPVHDGAFPNVELPANMICQESSNPSPNQKVNLAELNAQLEDNDSLAERATNDGNNDEMLEVTPEVHMFFGNHFLTGGSSENGAAAESDQDDSRHPPSTTPSVDKNDPVAMVEQSMARHKEMAKIRPFENGLADLANGLSHAQFGLAATANEDGRSGSASGMASYNCRLCGKVAGNGASLFAHLLYPHYAHLWREEVPHRAARYDCKECQYSTVKRQHFVMHVARVHDELRKKLTALGENLEVLDNLTQKSQSNTAERIVSTIAKGVSAADDHFGQNDDGHLNDHGAEGSPNAKDLSASMVDEDSNKGCTPDFVHTPTPAPTRFPRGFKPFVKCRLCGKVWKGKDNFFTHLVSTHFKYLWAKEVPRSADMFHCHVTGCKYQSKYRYNFLFHLAGKHKQLKQKLAEEGIPPNVLIPIETDGSEFGEAGAPPGLAASSDEAASFMGAPADMLQQARLLQQQQQRLMTTPPSALKSPGTRSSSNNTRLICRVCSKVSLNHTCHRQHVVGKHFNEFWAYLTADRMGVFNCHHTECSYKTPNRSVFIIHLAYVHQELKKKLIASGKDPNCANPDVYGKRKRHYYDNTQHTIPNALLGQSPASNQVMPTKRTRGGNTAAATPGSSAARQQEAAPDDSDSGCNRCNVCKAEFPRRREAVEHMALAHFHHVWDDTSGGSMFAVPLVGPFVCQHCPFTSVVRQQFICHMVSMHDALKHVLAIHFNGERTMDDLIESGVTPSQAEAEGEGEGDGEAEGEAETTKDDDEAGEDQDDESDIAEDEEDNDVEEEIEEDEMTMEMSSQSAGDGHGNDNNLSSW